MLRCCQDFYSSSTQADSNVEHKEHAVQDHHLRVSSCVPYLVYSTAVLQEQLVVNVYVCLSD
jgi:hypothetical protein